MVKTCKECKNTLPTSHFSKQADGKFGVKSKCKVCLTTENIAYTKTKEGVATQILVVQKRSAANRGMDLPSYTKEEFKQWLFSHPDFDRLYTQWKDSGYSRNLAVSVNRIDDYKSYTMDNIELMTWAENRDERHKDVLSGANNKQSKSIDMFTLDNEYIQTFYSLHEAERKTGISSATICNCCKGKAKTAGKYIWRYTK